MQKPRFIRYAAFALFLGLGSASLTGCVTTPPTATYPEITFKHLKPLNLQVDKLSVVDQYQAPMSGNHVEHRVPQPPEKALKRWANDRINAIGGTNRARFTILDASVQEQRLETDKDIKARFTNEQSEKYDASLRAKLEILDSLGNVLGQSEAHVRRTQTVPEDATLDEREKMWFELTEKMLGDFNTHMEKNIREHLSRWIK